MQDTTPKILIYIVTGFFISASLVLISKFLVDYSDIGHRIETLAFELLQGQISSFNPKEELPVVVVDISNMPTEGGLTGRDRVFDRDQLTEVVKTIADQKPLAIGVDLVLSPENQSWRTPYDEKLFEDCLEVNKNVPIFLGVESKMGLEKPEGWLGAVKFKPMAATLAMYREDAKRIPLWAKDKNGTEVLPSMSFALAEAAGKKIKVKKAPFWLLSFIETVQGYPGRIDETDNGVVYANALVNYSKLEAIQQTDLLNISEISVKEFKQKFENRIVLIGAARDPGDDASIVPDRKSPVAGVYLQASFAYTLLREPIYEFKPVVRILLDFIFSAFVILFVAIRRGQNISDPAFDWHKLQRKLVWRGGLVILLFAIFFTYVAGILWLDFIIIIIALLFHPWLGEKIEFLGQHLTANNNQDSKESEKES